MPNAFRPAHPRLPAHDGPRRAAPAGRRARRRQRRLRRGRRRQRHPRGDGRGPGDPIPDPPGPGRRRPALAAGAPAGQDLRPRARGDADRRGDRRVTAPERERGGRRRAPDARRRRRGRRRDHARPMDRRVGEPAARRAAAPSRGPARARDLLRLARAGEPGRAPGPARGAPAPPDRAGRGARLRRPPLPRDLRRRPGAAGDAGAGELPDAVAAALPRRAARPPARADRAAQGGDRRQHLGPGAGHGGGADDPQERRGRIRPDHRRRGAAVARRLPRVQRAAGRAVPRGRGGRPGGWRGRDPPPRRRPAEDRWHGARAVQPARHGDRAAVARRRRPEAQPAQGDDRAPRHDGRREDPEVREARPLPARGEHEGPGDLRHGLHPGAAGARAR